MDLRVRDAGFLIFGGTAGIGLAAAETLAADGARLVLVGRDSERAARAAADLARRHGTLVRAICGDLDRPDEAERITEQAAAELGGLRGMAITTGLGPRGQRNLLTATDADWTATFDDVLLGTARACRAAVPALIAAGGGAIVTTAAYSVHAPNPNQAPYAALKAAVATLTKAIAKSHGADGVRANCVCPARPRRPSSRRCARSSPQSTAGRGRPRSSGRSARSGACTSPSAAPGVPTSSAT
jgi:3-oxoacyl-[acyl-carrier protein] reductase